MEKLFTLSDVARAQGVSQTSVRAWIRDGIIPGPEFVVGQAKAYSGRVYEEVRDIIMKRREQRAKIEKERAC